MSYIFSMAWAAFLPLLFASQAFSADALGNAAAYSVDKTVCRLIVPDEYITRAIDVVRVKYGMTRMEAILAAAQIGTYMQEQLAESGRTAEYCEARRVK